MARFYKSQPQMLWPEPIRGTGVQETIENFFGAADDPTNEGSEAFGKCFTSTGELVARGHVCKGYDELTNFRKGAWDPITARRHNVRKAYISSSNDRDIIVLGTVTFGHKNGQSLTSDFVGNFLFDDKEDGSLIQNYQAWMDLKPLSDLIAEAGAAQKAA